jgi:hypothetical protein
MNILLIPYVDLVIVFLLISMPFVVSQQQFEDIVPNEIVPPSSSEQMFSREQINEFASNGTSFDTFVKQLLTGSGTSGSAEEQNEIIKTLLGIGDQMGPVIASCNTQQMRTLYSTLCDGVVALIYEVCQAIPYEVYMCISPDVSNYMRSRNMMDGQTDKLAYTILLSMIQ